jgi:type IV pilus assembly protein PilW
MKHARGFTIIEFMIAMTLSLLVLAALTAAFVASSRSRVEIEKANEQIENGRFALQILSDDLEMAGYLSHFDIDLAMNADTELPPPAAKPNPCIDASSAGNLTALRAALPMHIQGYDSLAALDSNLDDCLADHKPFTDIVVVRRTATCVRNAANCAAIAGAAYFQASLCADHLDSLDHADFYRLDTTIGNLNRTTRNCTTTADPRQYRVHIYFIANNDVAGDGIPTLKRAELGNAADPDGFTIVPLAHGIEDLQFDYGVDSDGDGAPDAYTSDPDIFDADGAGGPYADCAAHTAECITNWRNVVAVRLNVLARNSTPTRDHVDSKVYILGQNDDGSDRCARDTDADGTCEAFGNAFKRHVYQTSVRLNNPAGRRES